MPWRKIKWRKIKGNHQSKAEITKKRGKLALEKNQMRSPIKVRDNEGPSFDPTSLKVDKVKLLKQDTNNEQKAFDWRITFTR